MEIHILLAGVEIGPFSEKQVRQYLTDGLVSPSDPAKHDGMKNWEPVQVVLAKLPRMEVPASASAKVKAPPVAAISPTNPEPKPPGKPPRAIRPLITTPSAVTQTPPSETTSSPAPAEKPPAEKTPVGDPPRAIQPAASQAPTPADPTSTGSMQKGKRKPSKIVIQPMLPLRATPPATAKTQASALAASSTATTGSPARKMIAVKAILPANPPALEQRAAGKKAPVETTTKVVETKTPRLPPPLPAPKEEAVTQWKIPPFNLGFLFNYRIVGAVMVVGVLIGSFVYWKSYQGTASASSGTSAGTPVDPDAEILASHPTTADGFNKQGTVRQAKGDLDGAITDYDQAIALEPNNVLAFYQRGLAKRAKQDWNGALADFNQSLILDPRHAETYSNRGFVKQCLGDLDGAIADYTQSLLINPKIVTAYYNRGLIKGQRGDLDGALADYSQALAVDPKIALAYFNRGRIKSQRGDLDGAITDFNRTIDLDPTMADAYYYRGNAKNTEGNIDGAIGDYTQALAINPKIAVAYGYRGSARQSKGDLTGAMEDYTQALTLNPKMAAIYYNRSLIREQTGDLDGAISDSTQALQLNPKDAQSYCNRGLAKLGKGDLSGALVDLKTYCQMAPRDNDVDIARLYLWLISTKDNPQGHADHDLTMALTNDWNSPPDSLSTKIAKFLLGHGSESDLIAIATDQTQDAGTRCKAWYFAGMKRLLAGQKAIAVDYLQKALTTGKTDCCEYIFAQHQLQELGQSLQPTSIPSPSDGNNLPPEPGVTSANDGKNRPAVKSNP